MTRLRWVFMGTPEFAVPALRAVHRAYGTPCLVITQPDRPKGRGRRPAAPPVKTAALEMGCQVLQPERLTAPRLADQLARLHPDVYVVVAFGHLLSPELLSVPRLGAVNLHASLLPKYRGAAPIQRAIMNAETETGVTTMHLDTGMDTGDILGRRRVPIGPQDTFGTLHDRLAHTGAEALTDTLAQLANGTVRPVPQNHAEATYAPMLTKTDGHIDWCLSADRIDCLIRGVTPWPGAYTFHNNRRLKLFSVQPVPAPATAPPGTVITGFAGELRVATGNGVLSVLELQGASGKRMSAAAFLRGAGINPGDRLT